MTDGFYHPPGVTDDVKVSIRRTWGLFKEKGSFADLGRPMFMKLFEMEPKTKQLFHYNGHFDGPLNNHIEKLFGKIGEAVDNIDDLTWMTFDIIGLGRVHHSNFKVDERYYLNFGACLVDAIKSAIGDDMGKDDEEAWKHFYNWLGGCIVKGINDSRFEELEKHQGQTKS